MVRGRRTPTKEEDSASIDIFCDESTAPNIKSVRPNCSRRSSPVVMEMAPDSPLERRSKRIERTKQRVVEAKSRDRLSEYSNSPGSPTKAKRHNSTSSVPRDQSRSPVVHVVETKKTQKYRTKSNEQRSGDSPTSLDAELKSSMAHAKHKNFPRTNSITDRDDQEADASILPKVSVVPIKKEENQSKRVSWHSGVRRPCHDESSAEGTYDDMTVDTEWSTRTGRCFEDGNFSGEIFDELLDCGYFCK
jgi:hypothetical protein